MGEGCGAPPDGRGEKIISAWEQIMNGFDFSALRDLLLSAMPALLCITLHELGHGYVACKLGDDTAKNAGRLTLNPLKHIDPFGLLLLLVAHVGWAKPVPVDMRKFRDPKRGMALTALAGPACNLLIAVAALFLYGLALPFAAATGRSAPVTAAQLLYITAHLSLGLGLFNLLPIPPLDGSKVLFSLLPDESYWKLMRYERYGMLLLFALAWLGVTGRILSGAINAVFHVLLPVAELGARLALQIIN